MATSLEIIHVPNASSTMEVARERFNAQTYGLIVADSQTGGRGTRGRDWLSPPGNLYLTVSLPLIGLPANRLKHFALEAGLNLLLAIESILPSIHHGRLQIKWPNDLLLNDKKIAGLLIEIHGNRVLVGAGINIDSPPLLYDGGREAAGLRDLGIHIDLGMPIAKYYAELLVEALLSDWTPLNTPQMLSSWSQRALWGKSMKLRNRDGQPQVIPLRLTPDGHLVVRHETGAEEVLISEYLF